LIEGSNDALATKKVYSPHVVKGEFELEYRGGVDFDDNAKKDGKEKHKTAVGYGATDWWFTELYVARFEKANNNADLEYEGLEWENRFQISEPGAWWVDLGLYVAYEFAVEDEHSDKIESKLLLEKEMNRFVHKANLILESEVGGDSEEALEGGVAWSTRYLLKEYFEPGVEWHGEFGAFEDDLSWDEQKHLLGPVIYGKIGDHVKYDVGYLFGVSDAAPQGELKWVVELEWHF
jgi:hypothetical protein